jgi:hypothetical protein
MITANNYQFATHSIDESVSSCLRRVLVIDPVDFIIKFRFSVASETVSLSIAMKTVSPSIPIELYVP